MSLTWSFNTVILIVHINERIWNIQALIYVISWIYAKTIDNFLFGKRGLPCLQFLTRFDLMNIKTLNTWLNSIHFYPSNTSRKHCDQCPRAHSIHMFEWPLILKYWRQVYHWINTLLFTWYYVKIWISLSQEHMSCFLLNPALSFELKSSQFIFFDR